MKNEYITLKLPKKYDKRAKLSDNDITRIVELKKEGHSYRFIANKFGVSLSTVFWHTKSKIEKIEISKIKNKNSYGKQKPEYFKSLRERKKDILGGYFKKA